jgi:predicted DNA binding CopG/RHH family protein
MKNTHFARTESIHVRLSYRELSALRSLCEIEGLNISQVLRFCLREAVNRRPGLLETHYPTPKSFEDMV